MASCQFKKNLAGTPKLTSHFPSNQVEEFFNTTCRPRRNDYDSRGQHYILCYSLAKIIMHLSINFITPLSV
jgi:hypothetical protein